MIEQHTNENLKVFHHIDTIRKVLDNSRHHQRIGLVPTMGNLHDGHLHLVKTAQQYCDIVVVSVFVNPTQFGIGEDFESYPRTLQADCEKLAKVGCDMVFAPSVEEMYPSLPTKTHIHVEDIANQLCGQSRPTHFAGVGLIVSKLFNIIQPTVAVFGKKDYQQLTIIKQLVTDLNFPIQIIGAEIIRADDGLALSSRNQYLTAEERIIAPRLYQILQNLKQQLKNADFASYHQLLQQTHDELTNNGFRVDYLQLRNEQLSPVTKTDKKLVILVAAWLGNKARLLDNIEIDL